MTDITPANTGISHETAGAVSQSFRESFLEAAKTGDFPTLQACLDALQKDSMQEILPHALVNYQDEDGMTALMYAARSGKPEAVMTLLAATGIDPHVVGRYGHTALLCAASHGDAMSVEVLLGVPGINVNAKNMVGKTALMFAATRDDAEMVNDLLSMPGIDVCALDDYGCTALDLAHGRNVRPLIKAYMDKNPQPAAAPAAGAALAP